MESYPETIPFLPVPPTNTLILPISRHWFNMILKGKKKEECREAKPYWTGRISKWMGNPLKEPPILEIKFVNGYSKNPPQLTVLCESFHTRNTIHHKEWGEDLFEGKDHYVFNLGPVINKVNC